MVRVSLRKCGWSPGVLLCVCALLAAQQPEQAPAPLNESGQIAVNGRSAPYLIRHLPVSSFPDLPAGLVSLLNRRGCLIPQTYQAHHPENVVHASLESAGSSDWAVLCSVKGTVSLLVYFSSLPAELQLLAAAPESERLQAHGTAGVLGFDWGIDPASPEQIRQAQAGIEHRPPPVDHDALADSIIDTNTVYHFYSKGTWTVLDMPD